MLYEADGKDENLPWIKDVTGYQLFLETPDDFGGNSPYCSGEICRNGALNFMAAYQGANKYPIDNLLIKRFSTLSIQPRLPNGYISESLADSAVGIGNDIFGSRSGYQSGDPYNVPYHWGNRDDEYRTFYVYTATGTVLFENPDQYP